MISRLFRSISRNNGMLECFSLIFQIQIFGPFGKVGGEDFEAAVS